jgi:hypothetical protein
MSRAKVPVLAITETRVRRYDSVNAAAKAYGLKPSQIGKLIESGQLYFDGRTCFDYVVMLVDG